MVGDESRIHARSRVDGNRLLAPGLADRVQREVFAHRYNGDPWNGRTLEWSIPSPAPHYNFATLPQVSSQDEWWEEKQRRARGEQSPVPPKLEPIHMPRNSGIPFVMSMFWFTAGFGFVFDWVWMTVAGLAGVAVCMLVHSFNYNTGYYIPVEEITRTEAALRGNTSMAHINDSVHAGHPAPHSDHHDHPDMEEMRTFGFWIYLMTDVIIFGTLFAAYIVLQPNRNGGPGPEDLFHWRHYRQHDHFADEQLYERPRRTGHAPGQAPRLARVAWGHGLARHRLHCAGGQ